MSIKSIVYPCAIAALIFFNCSTGQKTLRSVPDEKKKVLLVENFKNNSIDGKKWEPWELGLPSMIQDDFFTIGYFKIVSAESRNKALAEMAFGESGLTETKYIELGKMLGAEWILFGDYIVMGDSMSISVKVIDVQTSGILASSKKIGSVNDFFTVTKNVSVALLQQFKYNLTSNEVSAIENRVETKKIHASLDNYYGEQLVTEIQALEMKKKKSGVNKAEIDRNIEELRNQAAYKFKSAVKEDPGYKRAKENLNKMTLMLPSSI